ncbi:MAG TPA: trigger factor [Bacteroidota bacterium]
MQITINTISDVEQEANIEVTQAELQPHFDHAYEEYRPKVEVRGFRKGRVPMPMIRQLYGQAIEYEALDDIANVFFHQAMHEQKIEPMGRPSITDMDFKRGERFTFKVKYEVRPKVELKRYKGLKLEKYVHPVTDQEVDDEIQRLRRINSTAESAEKVLDDGYAVTADVQELDKGGTPLIGRKTPNVRFHLIDPDIAPEIKEALKNAEPGRVYRASIESQHGDHKHSSDLALTVTKVEKVTLPPFDDALASKVSGGKVPTAAELQANIRRDLERYWDDLTTRRLNDDLAGEVVKEHEFSVPASLVNGFLDAMIDDVKNRARDKKLPQGFDEKKFREENRAYAIWQSKWMLLKDRIAEVEGLTVTEEDMHKAAERDAATLPIDKERLMAHYKTSESAQDRLLTEKVMSFLKAQAHMTEKIETGASDLT